MGVSEEHPPSFVVDRPRGLDVYVLMRFLTPFEALTADGPALGRPGECLLHDPGFSHWHRGVEAGFSNDWIHFRGKEVAALLDRYGLPRNRIFRPPHSEAVPTLLHEINRERHRRDVFWSDRVSQCVGALLLYLGRSLQHARQRELTPAEAEHLPRFRDVRMQVHERLAESWSVEAMAEMANLSPNRFSVLYRRFFQVSPVEDLICARIRRAKLLLTNATVSVGEAARRSGFTNVYYFSRLFRQRVGCSPRTYYRTMLGGS
jgi:AraC-like DNA-binding protein